jgi:hypothetical protein
VQRLWQALHRQLESLLPSNDSHKGEFYFNLLDSFSWLSNVFDLALSHFLSKLTLVDISFVSARRDSKLLSGKKKTRDSTHEYSERDLPFKIGFFGGVNNAIDIATVH